MTMAETAGPDTKQPDPDDISVNTVTIDNLVIEPRKELKESTLKWRFSPKKDKSDEVARTHFNALKKIKRLFPEVQIFNNHGDELKEFASTLNYSGYLRHFKLQYVKDYPKKRRKAMYLVYHRIISPVPIGEIRRNSEVAAMLQNVNAKVSTHQWTEDDTRISVLGFHVKVDPSNCLQTEMEERLKNKIAMATGRNIKTIPRFRCGFCSPFVFHDDGTRTATKSYDVQVRSKDAKLMIELLQRTYQEEPTFIFHKLRHHNKQTYTNAIKKQNNYLSKSRVIPIKGVHKEVMFHLENKIRQIAGVQDILQHRLTDKIGRWSIVTDEEYFKATTSIFDIGLENQVNEMVRMHGIQADIEGYDTPQLAFKNRPTDDSSQGTATSFLTYATACNSVFTMEDDKFNEQTMTDRPVQQAWGGPPSIPKTLTTTVMSTPMSSIAAVSQVNEELAISEQERARLAREVSELRAQVQILIEERKKDKEKEKKSEAPAAVIPVMPPINEIISIHHHGRENCQPTTNLH